MAFGRNVCHQKRAECVSLLDRLFDGAEVRRDAQDLAPSWIASLRAEIADYDAILSEPVG